MKKLLIAACIVMCLPSCKKDYVCECKITRTSGSSSNTTADGEYTFKDNRARAESRCNEQETTGTDLLGDYTRDCQVK